MLAALLLALLLTSCGGADEPSQEVGELVIRSPDRTVTLEVEIADDADERSTGLMGRERLDPFDGMAFVWDEPVRTSFWMKNTLIPLSIAFWNEGGRIVSILDMEPCEAAPCPLYDPGREFVGAVEVDQGTFDRRGIEVGDRVELRTDP